MDVLSIIFLIACILVIVIKYRVDKREENNHSLDDEANNLESGNIASDEKKEELQHTYDTVNMWTNNCDQKAGILLAIIGVIITILLSSNFMKNLKAYIFNPFIDYWTGNSDLAFSWSRFNVFFLLLISAIMLIMSCHYLFKTINANIDYQKFRNDNPEFTTVPLKWTNRSLKSLK